MLRTFLLLLAAGFVSVSCASKIEGETAAPPPPGGPKASSDHPPGEDPKVLAEEKR